MKGDLEAPSPELKNFPSLLLHLFPKIYGLNYQEAQKASAVTKLVKYIFERSVSFYKNTLIVHKNPKHEIEASRVIRLTFSVASQM